MACNCACVPVHSDWLLSPRHAQKSFFFGTELAEPQSADTVFLTLISSASASTLNRALSRFSCTRKKTKTCSNLYPACWTLLGWRQQTGITLNRSPVHRTHTIHLTLTPRYSLESPISLDIHVFGRKRKSWEHNWSMHAWSKLLDAYITMKNYTRAHFYIFICFAFCSTAGLSL